MNKSDTNTLEQNSLNPIFKLIPGIILAGILTAIAIYLGDQPWFMEIGLGALTLAILLGIIVGNTFYPVASQSCDAGIKFAKHYFLRAGIILYGFRLTFQQITDVGATGVIIDALTLTSTFLLAYWLGKKVFGLDEETTLLIGAGSSICGAAAVMATEPVVKASASKVAVAVSTVVIFGTICIFVYPWIYQLNAHFGWFPATEETFGIYIGSTVHEVAQVVAAGHTIGTDAENASVIAKMIRVMMLAPFLIILSAFLSRKTAANQTTKTQKSKITIPWFAVFFIVVAGFNSLNLLPQALVQQVIALDTILLAMAMVALGLTTHVSAIRQAGIKPLLMALILFVWLIVGGLLINLLIQNIF
ncbi:MULTISPECIES: YeiH family protein [Providencia]|uniref:YeiH family protein n=1 Tax=Providencia TaxID=586 RepID=UPI0013E077E4|nr:MULTISPECIES: YeiH family protein [Providencia]ELR5288036.1 YeiH family putative sulfate export transporter [Providencia rettgeri]EMB5784639.1 YeiH family putative sulfate export transporter [Providencia rettgeri]EMC8777227.1 YeiH family putative sulfate export transporter [Providencia rettgeri]MBG5930162.1 YeiH family putative sulfate export transporter [Providencia rettgeri]MBI6192131.1 YeiH family putative sulfate export transporter [Providencia rettgeri]